MCDHGGQWSCVVPMASCRNMTKTAHLQVVTYDRTHRSTQPWICPSILCRTSYLPPNACNVAHSSVQQGPPQLVVVSSCMRRDLLCGLSRLTIWQSGNLLPGRNFRQSHSFFHSLYRVPLSTRLQLLMQSKCLRFEYDPESRRLEREEVIIERSPSAIIQ